MTEPAKFDDDWAELARELERDKPTSPPPPIEIKQPTEEASEFEDSELMEQVTEAMDATVFESDEAGEGILEGSGDADLNGDSGSGDDQTGPGKKRRRRRRRRRKAGPGQPVDGESNEDLDSEKTDSVESETQEIGFAAEPAQGDSDYSDEPGDEIVDDLEESPESDSEEDAGGELLRELIANWNVPSWDDVVSGLYRPDR
ncbi:MAG TPA: hypothetical protein VG097_20335 [Gemmata sp.]|jgi:ribonuclease E|nr:hypothetical protein [Gemmata sp.]